MNSNQRNSIRPVTFLSFILHILSPIVTLSNHRQIIINQPLKYHTPVNGITSREISIS